MTLTVISGDEDSCVLIVMDIRRLAVQWGRSVDSPPDWIHTQPARWVVQNSVPARKLLGGSQTLSNRTTAELSCGKVGRPYTVSEFTVFAATIINVCVRS